MVKKILIPLLWPLLGVAACLLSGPAQAETALQTAQRFFAEMTSFRADFVQQLIDPDGRQLQSSSGRVMIQRPNRFRWDYQLPYRQLIVADGEQLWIYDEDLEQVTVASLETALDKTPALLLSQPRRLDEDFIVTPMSREDQTWIRLLPKDTDSLYSEIHLAITTAGLQGMELIDGFGQVTRLVFSNVRINATSREAWFRFVPPPGVDIVRDQPLTGPSP